MDKFLLYLFCLCFFVSCKEKAKDSIQVINVFKQRWKDKFYGFDIQGRGINIFLLHKTKCDYQYYVKYDTIIKTFVYTTNNLDTANCVIDMKDPDITDFLKLYLDLDIKSIDSRFNQHGVIELGMRNEDYIYYVKRDYAISGTARKWLRENTISLDSGFYYVLANDRSACVDFIYKHQ